MRFTKNNLKKFNKKLGFKDRSKNLRKNLENLIKILKISLNLNKNRNKSRNSLKKFFNHKMKINFWYNNNDLLKAIELEALNKTIP